MKHASHWNLILGTPNFMYRNLVAVYHKTDPRSGYADYRVFPAALPASSRTLSRVLAVGGLPARGLSDQIADRLGDVP
jgi:hypothetical protein